MALPKIDMPIYQCDLPSTGKKIRFRPFTVKEEKILLTARETEDIEQMLIAIRQILSNCLIDTNIETLTSFDIEYLLIQIRSKSVDNKVSFEVKDPDTDETVKLELDLSKVEVQRSPEHNNKIKVSDEYTIFLKYPTIESVGKITEDLTEKKPDVDNTYRIISACLDKLASKDEVYNFKDFSQKEVEEFLESLHADTVKSIKKFFDTMPKIRHEMKYKNSKGDEKTFVIEGTRSFFI